MGYTAGTLDLSILGASDSAVKSISNVEKSLNSLSRSIQIFTKTDINKTFSKLAESVNIFSQSAKNLDVSGFEKLSVIGKTGKGINSLANSISKLNATSTVFATQQLSNLFEKLSQTTSKIDAKNLDKLASAAKSLNSISKLSSLEKTDWSKVSAGFTQLATSITPFIDKIKEAEKSLVALYGVIQKVPTNKMEDLGSSLGSMFSGGSFLGKIGGFLWKGVKFVGKTAWNIGTGLFKGAINLFKKPVDSFGKLLKLSTWTGLIYSFKRLGSAVYNITKNGADFSETLNLWQVSMGEDLIPQATEFVNKLNEAYGISKKTLMNSQAIFKNMLGSLGELTSEQAYALSEGITQMALDYASLYNVKFKDAMTKFQAALAGQVRPIRSVAGYDITENTLFQLYQTLGGTKTMRQLSRTEKQLLAIYAVFEQMDRSGAIGDLNKTLPSFANQSRVFADAWSDVKTYAGLALTSILENLNVMPYINASLIFLARLFEGISTSMKTGLGDSAGVFGETEGAIEDTTEAVEELQSALLDFDKFRSLDSGLAENGDNVLGIDQTIIDAMTRYDGILEGASLEAREMADTWLESLGWLEDGELKIKSWQDLVDDLKSKVENINWDNIATSLSTKLKGVIDDISAWFGEQDWKAIGEEIAALIETNGWGDTWTSSIDLFDKIFSSATTAFNSFITTEEWETFKTDFTAAITDLVTLFNDEFSKINWQQIGTDLKTYLESPEFDAVITVLGEALGNIMIVAKELVKTSLDTVVHNWVDDLLAEAKDLFEKMGLKSAADTIETLITARKFDIKPFASGGLPDKGSMFVAGEAGAEMVYNMPSGQSGVANIAQIAQATYSGTMKALNDWWGGSGAKSDIPQLTEANPTGMYQAVTGVARQYGKGWSKM